MPRPTAREVEHAVGNHKRIVPLFRRTVTDIAIPASLGRFQRIDCRDDDQFDAQFAEFISAIDTDLDWVKAHTRLLARAREWEREKKDQSFLLRGRELRESEQWLVKSGEKDPRPTALQSQYLLASRQATTKRQRSVTAAVTIALVIAAGLAVYAFLQKNTAQREAAASRAKELAAFSTESLSDDPEKSILLAIQALDATLQFRQPAVYKAQVALHRALLASQLRMVLRGPSEQVIGVSFSPDGTRLAAASLDGTAKLWDAASGKDVLTLRGHKGGTLSVAFSPDGKRLVTTGADDTAKVWDVESGRELLTVRSPSTFFCSATFSPDGGRLATITEQDGAAIWDAQSGKPVLALRDMDLPRCQNAPVVGAAFSPDGTLLATINERTAKIWNLENGKALSTLRGHSAPVVGLAFSPDGKRLATASPDNTARVWDVASGNAVLTLRGHSDSVYNVAFSPDGQRLATTSEDDTLKSGTRRAVSRSSPCTATRAACSVSPSVLTANVWRPAPRAPSTCGMSMRPNG